MSKKKDTVYNHHGILIKYINISVNCEILFSLDFMDISLRTSSPKGQFVKDLSKHLTLIDQKKERHCKNPIWHDLFNIRTYFSLGNNQVWVLTEKAQPLRNIDAIIRLPHPSPSNIVAIEVLDKINADYWVSKLEPTFDIITDKPEHRNALQTLLKQTLYLRHGRNAFKKGKEEITNYINFRTSIKQTRLYQKDITDKDIGYQSLRFEFQIKRRKLFSEDIIKPTDVLKYDMSILDEIGFYKVNEIKLKRSLLDYDTNHFFSELIAIFVNNHGFHATQLWARRIKECPLRCDQRHNCKLMIRNRSRKQRFIAIQKCIHARPIANFRSRYCQEIKEMDSLKDMMLKAFHTWKS
jgi:hypothetical protein